jgi:membrane protein implicated in regulation of membrane protease activity
MPAWLVWVIVAAVLGGVEMLSLTLVAVLLGVAAVATAALGVGGAGQAAAFAVTSGVSIAILLPALRRHRRSLTSRPRSGVALVGQSAQVLELVDAQYGRVRIGGEIWSARAYVLEQVIPVGTVVDVFEIRGATALVYAEDTT